MFFSYSLYERLAVGSLTVCSALREDDIRESIASLYIHGLLSFFIPLNFL